MPRSACVYPVAIKVVAGWFRRERGVAVGVLVGALTIGSALPYLFRALGAMGGADWRAIVASASLAAVVGGLVALAGVRDGPDDVRAPRFSVATAARAFGRGSVRLANLGYLGHMWELYAMWTWVPLFIAASFAAGGLKDASLASLGAFLVVASGGLGCIVAGARRRSGGPDHGHDGGDGLQRRERAGDRVPVRRRAVADARARHLLGRDRRRRLGAVLDRRVRSSRRRGRPARRWRSRPRSGSS